MRSVSRGISRTKVLFDDDSLAANAGLILPFRVMAPSTLGTFLRSFTFGHVRQLDKVIGEMIRRAWTLGAGPGSGPMVIDLDSTICEVHGHKKHGAAYGYTHCLGYHPLVATRADTSEILHAQMRKGSSQRGHKQFVAELIARVRRCGATGPLSFRADSRLWSWKLIDTLTRLGVSWSITVPTKPAITETINAISDDAWQDITYSDGGTAQVTDTVYVTGKGKRQRSVRLVVPRTRLIGPQRDCGPSGVTMRSSRTTPSAPSKLTSSTVTTPEAYSRSKTSKKAPD